MIMLVRFIKILASLPVYTAIVATLTFVAVLLTSH